MIQLFPHRTATGTAVWWSAPSLTNLCWRDLQIIHRVYRFNASIPATVLDHTVFVMMAALQDPDDPPVYVAAYAAVHDLEEAITGEFSASLKQAFPAMKQLGDAWRDHIILQLGGPVLWDHRESVVQYVKRYDLISAHTEIAYWDLGYKDVPVKHLIEVKPEWLVLYQEVLSMDIEYKWNMVRDAIEAAGCTLAE